MNEPLLQEDDSRFVIRPIKYSDIWDMYKKAEASFWTAEEVDLSKDRADWETLNDGEKHFLSHVLAFFAGSDGIVAENLILNFAKEFSSPEVRSFYGFQWAIENIHSEVYSDLIETYITDYDEKKRLFSAVTTMPCVAAKADFMKKYMDPSKTLGMRLIAFSVVEGVFFSGSFCAVFWMRKRGKLPGLCFANSLISRDEGLHTDFAVLLVNNYIKNKPSQEEVHEMVREATEIEVSFVCDALPCNLIGMNATLMAQYIKYCTDRLLVSLNYEKLYHVENPFEWMNLISLDGKTNFFEKRVAEYSMAGVGNEDNHEFSLDADF
tara:strand:+ start:478 stop:1443 length:966 start_codon:yes stop_codon:yes gene_type:complete